MGIAVPLVFDHCTTGGGVPLAPHRNFTFEPSRTVITGVGRPSP